MVGFDFGFEKSESCDYEAARLIFTTEKRMVDLMIKWRNSEDCGKFLDSLESIFLDEIHERTFNMDIILGCIKQFDREEKLNPETKVILASATLNVQKFKDYLNDCNVIEIKG